MLVAICKAGMEVSFRGGTRTVVSHTRSSREEVWRYEYYHKGDTVVEPSQALIRRTMNSVGKFISDNDLGIGEYSIMHSPSGQMRFAFPWVLIGATNIEIIARKIDPFMTKTGWSRMTLKTRFDPMGKNQVLYVTLNKLPAEVKMERAA